MNYVPKDEVNVFHDAEKYDLILCLSVTKWIHLNYGDQGLKLTFRKIFNQLRPGGKLILEVSIMFSIVETQDFALQNTDCISVSHSVICSKMNAKKIPFHDLISLFYSKFSCKIGRATRRRRR